MLNHFAKLIDQKSQKYRVVTRENRLDEIRKPGKKIIITASGMADGGPILDYLKFFANNEQTAFYFPGFLVPGTRGYDIASEHRPGGQKKTVEVDGITYEIRARMKQISGFSGHADEEDILLWLSSMKLRSDSVIRVVHGDVEGTSASLRNTLQRK